MVTTISAIRNFNPRTREGCDDRCSPLSTSALLISIHAPVKGATTAAASGMGQTVRISIHAPVKGATIHLRQMRGTLTAHFNPRTREGCDGLQIGSVTICSLINHIASRLKGSSIFESIIRVLLIFIEIKTGAKLRYILCVILLRTAFSLG